MSTPREELKKPEWPKAYRHKKTKKKVRVTPWWECIDPIISDKEAGMEFAEGRKFKIGAIVQVGWLLENEHGVWLGVGPKALEHFQEVRQR